MSYRSWWIGIRGALKASAGVWAVVQTVGLVALVALVVYFYFSG